MYPLNLSSSAQTCICRQDGKRQSLVWEPEIPIIRIETEQKALSLQKEIFWQRDKYTHLDLAGSTLTFTMLSLFHLQK